MGAETLGNIGPQYDPVNAGVDDKTERDLVRRIVGAVHNFGQVTIVNIERSNMSDYNEQRDIMAGLRILQGRYCATGFDEFTAEAGHELDASERARLEELGWFQEPSEAHESRWWIIYV